MKSLFELTDNKEIECGSFPIGKLRSFIDGGIDEIRDEDLPQLAIPELQRNLKWSISDCRNLIDSQIRGLTKISVHLAFIDEDVTGYKLCSNKKSIISSKKIFVEDGQQKLSTLYKYIRGIDENGKTCKILWNGKSFKDLDEESKSKLKNSRIYFTYTHYKTELEAKEAFTMINTTGKLLTAAEVNKNIDGVVNDEANALRMACFGAGEDTFRRTEEELNQLMVQIIQRTQNTSCPIESKGSTRKFLSSEELPACYDRKTVVRDFKLIHGTDCRNMQNLLRRYTAYIHIKSKFGFLDTGNIHLKLSGRETQLAMKIAMLDSMYTSDKNHDSQCMKTVNPYLEWMCLEFEKIWDMTDLKNDEPIPQNIKDLVRNSQGNRDYVTGRIFEPKDRIEYHHVVSRDNNGSNSADNLIAIVSKIHKDIHNQKYIVNADEVANRKSELLGMIK